MSIRNAIIHAGTQMFAHGQMYVALSKVTSKECLFLMNFDPASVKFKNKAIS